MPQRRWTIHRVKLAAVTNRARFRAVDRNSTKFASVRAIRATLNQWPPLINQAHTLIQPDHDNVKAGIHALAETADRIKAQAQKILAEHLQIINEVEGRADRALDNLAAAWANLQAAIPLNQPDPLAVSYHALWPKREAARGIPELLEVFITDADQLTRQINATLSTLQDQLRYVQETLGRLPKDLAEAQKTAEDWRSLQNLAEQLAALRASLENLSQETFAVNTREDVNNRLTTFHEQAEQVARIQKSCALRLTKSAVSTKLSGNIGKPFRIIQWTE